MRTKITSYLTSLWILIIVSLLYDSVVTTVSADSATAVSEQDSGALEAPQNTVIVINDEDPLPSVSYFLNLIDGPSGTLIMVCSFLCSIVFLGAACIRQKRRYFVASACCMLLAVCSLMLRSLTPLFYESQTLQSMQKLAKTLIT